MSDYTFVQSSTRSNPASVFRTLMDVHTCPHMKIHVDVLNNKFNYEVLDSCPFKSLESKLNIRKEKLTIWKKCTKEFPEDINYLESDRSYHIVLVDTIDHDHYSLVPGVCAIRDVKVFNFREWNHIIKSAQFWAYYEDFIKLINVPTKSKIII